MDCARYMENVFVRMTTAAVELTYLRRSLIKFLGINYRNLPLSAQRRAQTLSKICTGCEDAKLLRRFKNMITFDKIISKTAWQIIWAQDCLDKIQQLIQLRKNSPGPLSLRRYFNLSLIKIFKNNADNKFDLDALKKLEKQLFVLVDLIKDKYSSMTCEYEHLPIWFALLKDSTIVTSEKLLILVNTILMWLELISVFVQSFRYKSSKYCQRLQFYLIRAGRQLDKEMICFELIRRSVSRLEETNPITKTHYMSHRAIRNAYVRLMKTVHGDIDDTARTIQKHPGLKRRSTQNLYRTVCIRNAVFKTQSLVVVKGQNRRNRNLGSESAMSTTEKNLLEVVKSARRLANCGSELEIKLKALIDRVIETQVQLDDMILFRFEPLEKKSKIKKFTKILRMKQKRSSSGSSKSFIGKSMILKTNDGDSASGSKTLERSVSSKKESSGEESSVDSLSPMVTASGTSRPLQSAYDSDSLRF